jgi:AraC-like DNA-binding protein
MRAPTIPNGAFRIDGSVDAIARFARQHGLPVINRVPSERREHVASEMCLIGRAPTAVTWMRLGGQETQQGRIVAPAVHVIVAGHVIFRAGRYQLDAGPGDLVYVPAGVNLTLVKEPGQYCVWDVPEALVYREFAGPHRDVGGELVVPVSRLSASQDERHELVNLLDEYARSLDAGEPRPQALARWLARALARSTRIVFLSRSSIARLARVDAWLEAHLGDPISLEDLSRVAGCGHRALQKLFVARHGSSPMAYVRQRRLAAVRARLADGRGCSVTNAALDAGLNHLGRLAQAYRRMFGESPGATCSCDPPGMTSLLRSSHLHEPEQGAHDRSDVPVVA